MRLPPQNPKEERTLTWTNQLFIFLRSIHVYYAFFVSSCMAKHIFVGKSVVLHLFEGPELRTHYWEDREEKKSPAPGRIQTHDLSVMRHALYRCAKTAALGYKLAERGLWVLDSRSHSFKEQAGAVLSIFQLTLIVLHSECWLAPLWLDLQKHLISQFSYQRILLPI